MPKYDKDIKKIVRERLLAMPANVGFSIGEYGDFTRDDLIEQLDEETEVGDALIEMQVEFIKKMPKLLKVSRAHA